MVLLGKFIADVLWPDSNTAERMGGGDNKLAFPEGGFGASSNRAMQIPVCINFCADVYENKQMFRENAIQGNIADITLPLPMQLSDDSSISYSPGQTETTGGIWDMTPGGWRETWRSWFGLKTLASDFLGTSALYGQRPMDERDNIFKGAEMRTHSFEWIMIPKNRKDGETIDKIVKTFQRSAYPMSSEDEVYSRVIHPPVWQIRTFDLVNGLDNVWIHDPLPAVLSQVRIQTATGALHQTQGGYPAATGLTLVFKELEPAVNTGKYLQSRSQVRGGAARGGDL